MQPFSFQKTWSSAWRDLQLRSPERKARYRFEKGDFEVLKTAYVEKYGYSISIPQWDDIIRWKPTELMTPQEIRDRKLLGLQRILASPSPDFARSYSTVMTWIDNIQDTSSVIYPFFAMLTRWAPGIFGRMIPVMGWGLLFYDLLQMANAIGRFPMSPFKSKRAFCTQIRNNPFSKQAQWKRMDRVAKWNASWPDLIQALQVTADTTGVGLSLGAIVGFAQDLFWGAVAKANGERVSFRAEWPKLNFHEFKSAQALKAAAYINSSGQVFDDETHFWTFATWAASTTAMTPLIQDYDLAGIVDEPLSAILPAPSPEDPATIEVIKSQGLSVEDGVQWPFNREKQIPFKDLTDHTTQKGRETFRDYLLRHRFDQYGFIAAHMVDAAQEDLFDALEPQADYVADDTPPLRTFFEMLKHPVIPTGPGQEEKAAELERWINDYTDAHGHIPRIPELKQKMESLGMPYKEAYPQTLDPKDAYLFPPAEQIPSYD